MGPKELTVQQSDISLCALSVIQSFERFELVD